MKRFIIFIIHAIFAISTGTLDSLSKETYSEDYINSNAPPQDVIDRLKKHSNFFLEINNECARSICRETLGHLVWKLDGLPNHYVKRDFSRIRGRELLLACIQKHNLDRLIVPKKYLYHIPGTGTELNDNNYWVIVEEVVKSSAPLLITLEDAKQICTLIRCSGYLDFKRNNIIQTEDNKIAFIDSEKVRIKGVEGKCPGLGKIPIYTTNLNTAFTEDALKHILTQISECEPLSKEQYQRILNELKKQQKPHKWDYVSFFKNLYPQYSKSS